jgi:hypothetical protein
VRVIGIDPGIADGKPYAIVALDTDAPKLVGVCDTHEPMRGTLWQKYQAWMINLMGSVSRFKPDLVAIEDARGVGGKGSGYLIALVRLLQDWAEGVGVEVVLVNPSKVPGAVGARRTGVGMRVRTIVQGAEQLQETPESDYEFACAVALAGEAKWREEEYGADG